MQKFLMRRFLVAIVTVMAVSLVIFIMSRAAGDPRALLLDDYSTMEDWDRLGEALGLDKSYYCLLYTSPSPRDRGCSRLPSSA